MDPSLVAHLRSKIQEHHMEFTRLYPDVKDALHDPLSCPQAQVLQWKENLSN